MTTQEIKRASALKEGVEYNRAKAHLIHYPISSILNSFIVCCA